MAGPAGTFWYANLAFDRTDLANSVAASRSTDGGKSWTTSYVFKTSAADGAKLFNDKEWIGADYATWFDRAPGGGDTHSISGVASTDGGTSWSAPVAVSTAPSDAMQGSRFGFPTCAASFVGDYSGITVDSAGVAHSLWTDIRVEPSTGSDPGGTSQDPFTATLSS